MCEAFVKFKNFEMTDLQFGNKINAKRSIARAIEKRGNQAIVDARIESGKPLPLDVLLEWMDEYNIKAKEALEILESLDEDEQIRRINEATKTFFVWSGKAIEIANLTAPYFHPKLANIQLTGKDGGAIKVAHAHVLLNNLRDKNDDELARQYLDLIQGREQLETEIDNSLTLDAEPGEPGETEPVG